MTGEGRERRPLPQTSLGRTTRTVQFDVNGEPFVLNFNAQEGRWYLLRPVTVGMVEAIEVLDDEAKANCEIVVHSNGDGLKSIN